jgi:hypothetical protein
MIQTYFISEKELGAIKDYIVRNKKDWSIDYEPMGTSSSDKYPDMKIYQIKIEGTMTHTDAFHFGLFLAKAR